MIQRRAVVSIDVPTFVTERVQGVEEIGVPVSMPTGKVINRGRPERFGLQYYPTIRNPQCKCRLGTATAGQNLSIDYRPRFLIANRK